MELIPLKLNGRNEAEIKKILNTKLMTFEGKMADKKDLFCFEIAVE